MYQNLILRYRDCFRQNSELPALTDYSSDKTYTYRQLAAKIKANHLILKEHGIQKDDKIALIGKNSIDWICVYMSVITYGATIVPILADFNPKDMSGIINHSDSKLLFADKSLLEKIDTEALTGIQKTFSLEELPEPDFDNFNPEEIDYEIPDDEHVMIISYTSGTTGTSKGVMLPVRSLSNNVQFALDHHFHFRESRVLALLPLAHAYGCAFDMLTPLSIGSHVFVLGRTPSPRMMMEALAKVKPHLICSVPMVMEKIVSRQVMPALEKQPVKFLTKIPFINRVIYNKVRERMMESFGGCIKEINMGGAGLSRNVEKILMRIRFPFTVGYGMTECGPLISYSTWDKFKSRSCGQVLPGMEVMLDKEGYRNNIGEICVRGINVMLGYYKNPEATNSAIRDGWFHTGDIGTLDKKGTIFIKGRCKSMILTSSGQNIYPEEIETKLNALPDVLESVVYEEKGKLIALVYVDPERIKKSGFDTIQKEMCGNLSELNTLVAPYEKVAEIRMCSEPFEKTPKQSIKRFLYPKAAKFLENFS